MMNMYDIGMIGLAVMGENLVLNMDSKGFHVIGYDVQLERRMLFQNTRAKGTNIAIANSLEEMVQKLKSPRKIMLMIRAGEPVDIVIQQIIPLLEKGDILIDGGNSNYQDTIRRNKFLLDYGIHFIGTGVSGGEEGALHGPSIMPGGSIEAYNSVKNILSAISAKHKDGSPCIEYMGPDGAGHFVKMVHNGIEYGDIQLITEVYHLMRDFLGLSNDEMSQVFKKWNQGVLRSYLIEITGNILNVKETENVYVIDTIKDTAGQKGTGKWTAVESLAEGVPLSVISEAVYSRFLSSLKDERIIAANAFSKNVEKSSINKDVFLNSLEAGLYVAKILSYAQGLQLLNKASKSHDWNLNIGSIASVWKEGCIIRSAFLDDIKKAYDTNPELQHLIMDPFFKGEIIKRISKLRQVVSTAVLSSIPVPALSMAIAYFDGYTTENLPANLLQAMRDYFGAHTYERLDKEQGQYFHTNWTGSGGNTSSTTYNN